MDAYTLAEAVLSANGKSHVEPPEAAAILGWHHGAEAGAVLFADQRSDGAPSYLCVRAERAGDSWVSVDDSRYLWPLETFTRPEAACGEILLVAGHMIESSDDQATHTVVFIARRGVASVLVGQDDTVPVPVDERTGGAVAVLETAASVREVFLRPVGNGGHFDSVRSLG